MKLTIPEPCSEKWENMIPNKKGAFCTVCNKNVVDFTKQNKSRVIRYFDKKRNDKETCGRLSLQQLLAFNPPEIDFEGFFKRFRLWSLTKKISLIIFMFFGLGLASCGGGLVKEPRAINEESVASDSNANSAINPRTTDSGDTLNPPQQNHR